MRCRLLGIVAVLAATVLPARASGEICEDVLSFNEERPGEGRALLWMSERFFSEPLDPSCRDHEKLQARKRCSLRPQPNCSSAEEPVAPGWPPGNPTEKRVTGAWLEYAEAIVIGIVTETEPGLGGSYGHVLTRVRARVTEVIRSAPGKVEVESQVSFLAPGGRMWIDGHLYCTDAPSWVHAWRPGDIVLLAGDVGGTNDPTLVLESGMTLRIVEGRAFPPASWSPDGGFVDLAEVRSAYGTAQP